MKIPITIISNSQVSFKSMGGSDKIFIEMARVWKNSGYPLVVLACREAGKMCQDRGLKDNLRVISRFDVERMGLFFAYLFRTAASIFYGRIVRGGILYSASDFFPDLIFAFWQKVLNQKIIWVAGIFLIAHNPLKIRKSLTLRGIIYWITQRIAIKLIRVRADLVVVLSKEDKKFLINKGIQSEKITVISGGVDSDTINKIPQQEKKYDACFLGRFHQQKGLLELIKIWRKVVDVIPSARLAIIGWGDKYWTDFLNRSFIKNNLEENISLLGFLDHEKKYKTLKSTKVFVFPSSYESWGIVIAEAFACGLPVVAFDIDATRKFKDGITLVKLQDLDSFAKAIINFLIDPNLYSAFSQAAQNQAKQFSWVRSAELITENIKGV